MKDLFTTGFKLYLVLFMYCSFLNEQQKSAIVYMADIYLKDTRVYLSSTGSFTQIHANYFI